MLALIVGVRYQTCCSWKEVDHELQQTRQEVWTETDWDETEQETQKETIRDAYHAEDIQSLLRACWS